MNDVLFLTFTEADGSLAKNAVDALGAARQLSTDLGATLTVALVGESVQAVADVLANCGAARFLGVNGAEFAQPRYASDSAAAEAAIKAAQPAMVIMPSCSRTSRIAAGVAHRVGGHVDTHISGLSVNNGTVQATRWFYRQRMEGVLTRTARPWVLVVESGIAAPYTGEPGSAILENVTVALPTIRTNVTGTRAPQVGEQTIRPDAKLLFVAGAGWTKKQGDGQTHGSEAEQLILGFLRNSGASLGGSKSLVDLSGEGQPVLQFMTHLNQVGQTGATPRHPKGLSTCCHGEEPHVVGWRFITERRAINLDANCGWARGKADVVYVGDAFEVMKKVNSLLASIARAARGATA